MMEIFVVVLLFGISVVTLAQDSRDHRHNVDADIPEVDSDFLEDLMHFVSCLDGSCMSTSNEPSQTSIDGGHVKQKIVSSTRSYEPSQTSIGSGIVEPKNVSNPYLDACKELLKKKDYLEKQHPELKALKLKLLSYFESFSSDYVSKPEKQKELLVKLLTVVVHLIQNLKAAIEKELPQKPIPTEIPIYPTEEVIAEEIDYPGFVGSIRGIPGVHYPNYTEVPITSFSCNNVKYIPGFYADLETGCQVFHVCYEHRRESFLCPVGTTFNQPILACDYWYSSNCSLSPHYYDVNAKKEESIKGTDEVEDNIGELITTIIEGEKPILPRIHVKSKETEIFKKEIKNILKFLPIKAKIAEFPVKVSPVPVKPVPIVKTLPVMHPKLVKTAAAVPLVKTKVLGAAVPIVKAKVASAAAVPILKAKVASAAAVPIIKTRVASAAVPVLKTKIAASHQFKTKTAAKVIPFVKMTAIKQSPLRVKSAVVGVPVLKAKSAISPLTKKALAVGYMKLLKAKKFAVMG